MITSGETGRERKPFPADFTESSISLRFSGRDSPAGWILRGRRRDSEREDASRSPISLAKTRIPFGGPEPSLLRIGATDTMKRVSRWRKNPEKPSPVTPGLAGQGGSLVPDPVHKGRGTVGEDRSRRDDRPVR